MTVANSLTTLIIPYEIEVLTPFFVLKEPGQGFGGNQVILYKDKLYFIQTNFIHDNNFWQDLYKQLEQHASNNAYNKIYTTYNNYLWQYFKTHSELLNKLQTINLEFANNNNLPDLNKPTITIESLNFIFDSLLNEYKFYLPGSSIKGIFRRIIEIASKKIPNLKTDLLFGAINSKNSPLNNSLLIFEDIIIPRQNLAVFEIQRIRNPYNPKSGEAKNNFKKYIIGIKPGTIITGKIKTSVGKLRVYGERVITQYTNFIQQWARISQIVNSKIKEFYLNNLWKWQQKQWNLEFLSKEVEHTNGVIFQAGFGSTKMLKVNPEEYNNKGKNNRNRRYNNFSQNSLNKQVNKKSLPPTTTQYMDLKTKQPVGFIKITLGQNNE